jgi:hypothetical protein
MAASPHSQLFAPPPAHHSLNSPLVLVRFDYIARCIVNANHGIM